MQSKRARHSSGIYVLRIVQTILAVGIGFLALSTYRSGGGV
ncbi:MAG: hypothetical protein NT069_22675 [Planctomycetota bacterium]|nr:hypothetical protein [Planctomycetota bacterium]